MESLSALLAPSSLVLLAGAVQTAAMLFRNQVIMRCILIFGTALYIIYYLQIVSPPLYEAAFISTAIGVSTFYGLLMLLLDRSQLMLSSGLLPVYKAMGPMEPGQFRRLMRLGHRHILETDTVLTHEGKKPEKLFFIKSGTVIAEKSGASFKLTAPLFIGEIAYITGAPASATIRAAAGADVIEWHSATLQKATRRKPNLGLALDARLASDLAKKVATSVTFEAVTQKAPKTDPQS